MVLGVLEITIDGIKLPTMKGSTFKPGRDIYEAVKSVSGFVGHRLVERGHSELAIKVIRNSAFDDDLFEGEKTILVAGDDGKDYKMSQARRTDDAEHSEDDSTVSLTFTGAASTKVS